MSRAWDTLLFTGAVYLAILAVAGVYAIFDYRKLQDICERARKMREEEDRKSGT